MKMRKYLWSISMLSPFINIYNDLINFSDASLTFAETSPARICDHISRPVYSPWGRIRHIAFREHAKRSTVDELRRRGGCKFAIPPWESSPLESFPPSANLPCCPPRRRPNAPLGADLCIFNKFRESSKPSDLGRRLQWRRLFSVASQTVSSRLFMCEERNPSQPTFHPIHGHSIPHFLRPVLPISHSPFL